MKQNKSTKGFTLIELLIVVGVIAVLAGIVLVSLRGAKKGEVVTNNESFICGEDKMIDLEGNEYDTVEIGGLCWMKENLKYIPEGVELSNPEVDYESETDPRYYIYDFQGGSAEKGKVFERSNGTNPYEIYGVLYNWPAAMEACPPGTHLPSDEEWYSLERVFQDDEEDCSLDEIGWRCSEVGRAMKTSSWNGNNVSGFTALPSGRRFLDGFFYNIGEYADFWSSSEGSNSSEALSRYLYFWEAYVYRNSDSKVLGFSVRCVQ